MKKVLSVLMAFLITVSVIAPLGGTDLFTFASSAADIVSSGTCGAEGDNVTWTLDSEGTLTISGTGETRDFDDLESEEDLLFFNSDIKRVVIEDGVTRIGNVMFYGCKAESIEIAKSVKEIGIMSFYMCLNLKSIIFEDGSELTSIGDTAFGYDIGLEYIDIPDSVTEIGSGAFICCMQLKEFCFPAGLKSVGDYVLDSCFSLETLTFPEGVKNIESITYSYFPFLNKLVILSDDVDFAPVQNPIGYTIYEVKDLESYISAFYKLQGYELGFYPDLTEAEAKELQEKMEASLFQYDELQKIEGFTIVAHEGSTAEAYANEHGLGFEYSGEVPIVASGVCGKDGDNLKWEFDKNGLLTISGTGEMANYYHEINEDGTPSIEYIDDAPWKPLRHKVYKVVVENGVTGIGNYAFRRCVNLRSVEIADTVTDIAHGTFESCVKLKKVNIPGKVKEIAVLTFENCVSLENLEIPEGVETIRTGAFDNCYSLNEITLPSSVKKIDGQAFSDCLSLEKVTVLSPDAEFSLFNSFDADKVNPCLGFKWASYPCSAVEIRDFYIKLYTTIEPTPKTEEEMKEIEDVLPSLESTFKTLRGENYEEPRPIDGVVLHGYNNSTAQKYAEEYGFEFVSLDGAHEHSYTATVTKEATCTENGVKTYTCECGDSYTEIIPATGHTAEAISGKAATCTEDGLTDGVKCAVCGEVLTAQEVIPATEHENSEWIIDKEADCANSGVKHIECTVCKEILETEEIPALGHTFGEWTVTKKPTEEQEGEKIRTCLVCGETQTETIERITVEPEKPNNSFFDSIRDLINKVIEFFNKIFKYITQIFPNI